MTTPMKKAFVKNIFKLSLCTLSMMLSASAMNCPNITDANVLDGLGAFNDGPFGAGGNDWNVDVRVRVSDTAGNPVVMGGGPAMGSIPMKQRLWVLPFHWEIGSSAKMALMFLD